MDTHRSVCPYHFCVGSGVFEQPVGYCALPLHALFHLPNDGIEQLQRPHTHLQSYGVVLLYAAYHDGNLPVRVDACRQCGALYGRFLHLYFPLLSRPTLARVGVLRLSLYGFQQHCVGANPLFCAHCVGVARHKPVGSQRPQLCILSFRTAFAQPFGIRNPALSWRMAVGSAAFQRTNQFRQSCQLLVAFSQSDSYSVLGNSLRHYRNGSLYTQKECRQHSQPYALQLFHQPKHRFHYFPVLATAAFRCPPRYGYRIYFAPYRALLCADPHQNHQFHFQVSCPWHVCHHALQSLSLSSPIGGVAVFTARNNLPFSHLFHFAIAEV